MSKQKPYEIIGTNEGEYLVLDKDTGFGVVITNGMVTANLYQQTIGDMYNSGMLDPGDEIKCKEFTIRDKNYTSMVEDNNSPTPLKRLIATGELTTKSSKNFQNMVKAKMEAKTKEFLLSDDEWDQSVLLGLKELDLILDRAKAGLNKDDPIQDLFPTEKPKSGGFTDRIRPDTKPPYEGRQ